MGVDSSVIKARVERSFTQAYYARSGVDVNSLMLPLLERKLEDFMLDHKLFTLTDLNTDLFPKDEYGC